MKKPRLPARSVRPGASATGGDEVCPSPGQASCSASSGRGRCRDGGFTLIEVMVALIVLVLGVLGAAAMTLNALRDNKQSGLRSQATALAYEVSDLMRMSGALQEAVYTGGSPTADATCWTGGCSPAGMAQNNYYEWNQKVTTGNVLPNASAKICRDVANLTSTAAGYATCDGLVTSPLVVKMKWDEKNNNARGTAAPVAISVAYAVVPIQPY